MKYECPTCHRSSTDGTDTEFWCQICGAETPINEMRPSCLATKERIEKWAAMLERIERRRQLQECVQNSTKGHADSTVGAI